MKKFLTLLFFFPLFALAQTCDVDLIGYDIETNQVSVAILNGENCGCNEYTQQDGNTCDESTSSTVQNNDGHLPTPRTKLCSHLLGVILLVILLMLN
jgi:hypothetical protein